ncbi:hypothetical protein QJS10_CPA06g00406 [Acorus calamus]|uniref:Uncharacterized protein n=1 Tax=Acorus calamus TaxID=4465 RepID=A0AAV9EQ71_ACOCL|nr:hypothetical protein QJS10_CPA06g00406 [Acorus calamus]
MGAHDANEDGSKANPITILWKELMICVELIKKITVIPDEIDEEEVELETVAGKE